MMDPNYHISTDAALVQLDVVHGYLSTCDWSPGVRRDFVENAIANSFVAGAYEKSNGTQVGFARAVSDRASFAWLCDVFVLEPHRGHGLATSMVQALMAHPELQTLRQWMLGTRDSHAVYEPLGFAPTPPGRIMSFRLPEDRWKSPGGG